MLFAIALWAAACAETKPESHRLSATELRDLLPGSRLEGTVSGGGPFKGTYFRDGTMAIATANDSDTGTWEFDGDTVCLTWTKWRQGKRYCLYWERTATGYAAYFVDGRLSTTFTYAE
ncbi:MAG: hypothetical protein GY791_09075 [Alphaproteobacteria bacterium]|nr:hypothetical protein [Alphaproteobacteria bacterium]